MKKFPEFMQSEKNRVTSSSQHTNDIEGYYYTANDGSQMAFWTCGEDRISEAHEHEFDEYIVVIDGCYTHCIQQREQKLKAGDEIVIPAHTKHWGKCRKGTRTIHAFGGTRITK